MTNNPSQFVHPLSPLVSAALGMVFIIFQLIAGIAWFFGAMCGAITRCCGTDSETAFLEAEQYGVPVFWSYLGTIAFIPIWLAEKLNQFFAAHQVLGFVCFMLIGTCILYPLVRVAFDGRVTEVLCGCAKNMQAFPSKVVTQCQIVLSFALAMGIVISIVAVVLSVLAGVFLFGLSLLFEHKGPEHAFEYGTTAAGNILSAVFGGAWEFLCFLPGFAQRNPVIAGSSVLVFFVPVLEHATKELFG